MFDQARPSNPGCCVVRGMLMTAWQLVTDIGLAPTVFLLFGGYGSADCQREVCFQASFHLYLISSSQANLEFTVTLM